MRKKLISIISILMVLFMVINMSFLSADEIGNSDLESEDVVVNEEETQEEVPVPDEVVVEPSEVTDEVTPYAYELQPHEVIVNTYAELKSQIENRTNGKTTFYFGANITQTNVAIVVQWEKQQIIIDGTNPITGIRHTYEEHRTGNKGITLAANNPVGASITMQNMNIYGQNENGPVQIADNARTPLLHYNNIHFDGPQLVFNRQSTTIIENAEIIIRSSGYGYPSEEVGEVLHVIFRGNNIINHNPSGNFAIFFFNFANGSTTMDPGATVTITTTNLYNSIYASNNSMNGLSFYGKENSSFTMIQAEDREYGMKGTDGKFELKNGANFVIRRAAGSSSTPIFDWVSGSSDLNITGAKFELATSTTTSPLLKVGKISATNSDIFLHAKDGSSTYLAEIGSTTTSYPVRVEGGSFKMQIDGNSTASNSQGGLFQRGTWDFINAEMSMHAKGHMGNYMFNMADPKFVGSKINVTTDGIVVGQATASFMDVYSIVLDNSEMNMRANVNSGRMLAASTSFSMINGSKVNLYTERLDGDTQLASIPNSLDVPTGGEFTAISNQSNNGNRVVQVSGSITVAENATFRVVSNSGAIPSLIHFNGTGRIFSVNNPKSFVLFARETTTSFVSAASSVTFSFSGKQINQWKAALKYPEAGTLDNLPDFEYIKKNGTNYMLSGSFNINGGLLSFNSNHTAEDGVDPSGIFGLQVSAARIVSLGDLQVTQDEATQNDTILRGVSDPGAHIRIHYTSGGVKYTSDTYADASGAYAATVNPIDANDFEVEASLNFLYKRTEGTVISTGELKFDIVPAAMPFGLAEISSKTSLLNRLDSNWTMSISDTRSTVSNWSLLASIKQELTPADAIKPTLKNAFVFLDAQGVKKSMSSSPIVIAESNNGPVHTNVNWATGRGVMLEIQPGSVYKDTEYTGKIQWILQDAP